MERITTMALIFALVAAPAVYARDLFFENFDGKTDAQLLAEGWEYVAAGDPPAPTGPDYIAVEFNLHRTRDLNPPGERGIQTTGEYLMSDADRGPNFDMIIGSGQSYDVVTPAIDCSGVSEVWLNADLAVLLNNNGLAVFMIDVQANGGDWVTLETRVAPARFPGVQEGQEILEDDPYLAIPGRDGNMGALYGPYWLDISSVAAGQSNVRIRFRHFEEDWDWWVAIDNVRVTTSSPPAGEEVIFGPERFTGNDLPTTWTYETTFIDNEWFHGKTNIVNIDSIVHHHNLGAPGRYLGGNSLDRLAGDDMAYAIYQSLPDLSSTEDEATFAAPAIDCSDFEEVFVYYWCEFIDQRPAIRYYFEGSVDGGETFFSLFDYNQALFDNGEGSYAQEQFIAVPEAAGQSNVIFRFRGAGASGDRFFAFTDFTVTGNRTGTSVNGWALY